jgi:hypothetical protein
MLYTILHKHNINPIGNKKGVSKTPRSIEEISVLIEKYGIAFKDPNSYTKSSEKYTFICLRDKNHLEINRRLNDLVHDIDNSKDYIPCRECRAHIRLKTIEAKCENLEMLSYTKEKTTTSTFHRIKWKCKYCEHEFFRTDDEILRGGYERCNDCPKCSHIRNNGFIDVVLKNYNNYLYSNYKMKREEAAVKKEIEHSIKEEIKNNRLEERRKLIETIKVKLLNMGFELVEEFTSFDKTYKLKCVLDGTIIEKYLESFLKLTNTENIRCPTCYIQKVLSLSPNIEYLNCTDSKHSFKCKHCNYIFNISSLQMKPYDCPECSFIRKKKLKMSIFTDPKKYEYHCRAITKTVIDFYKIESINADDVFDHKFSIASAYNNAVPSFITCYPGNLEPLNKTINGKKSAKCSITLNELYIQFGEWLKDHPEYLEKVSIIDDELELIQ